MTSPCINGADEHTECCDSHEILILDERKVNVEPDADTPQISLDEMLDDLKLTDDATGAEGDAMQE